MSKFLDELRYYIKDSDRNGSYLNPQGAALDMIDSLGENARRMLEIGIVQDELVTLGFESKPESSIVFSNIKYSVMFVQSKVILYRLEKNNKFLNEIWRSYYNSSWQEDLLAKVRELTA